jgi:hypothetical protein
MYVLGVPLDWCDYQLYLVNNAAQTINVNWGLRVTPTGSPTTFA